MRRWLRRPSGGTDEERGDPELVTTVLQSPFFDHGWYAAVAGVDLPPSRALRHYLDVGRRRGLTPHPLFDPDTVSAGMGLDGSRDERDPLLAYVEDRSFAVATHPLFDAEGYVAAVPEAADHPWGPLGHYLTRGRHEGRAPIPWWPGERDLLAVLHGLVPGWRERQRHALPTWRRHGPPPPAPASYDGAVGAGAVGDHPTEWSVVTVVDGRSPSDMGRLDTSLASVRAQTDPGWEVIVVPVGAVPTEDVAGARVRVLAPAPTVGAAYARGVDAATGSRVAFLGAGDVWRPGRLGALGRAMSAAGAPCWAHDAASRTDEDGVTRYADRPASPEALAAGRRVALGTVAVDRALAATVGFDHELPAAVGHDHVLRLAAHGPPVHLPELGVEVAPASAGDSGSSDRWVDHAGVDGWHDVVVGRHLVDWEELAEREVDDGVAVVITVHDDWAAALRTVDSVIAAAESGPAAGPDQVVLVDRAGGLVTASVLGALAARHERLTLLHSPTDRGPALATSLALASVGRHHLVLLEAGSRVRAGWLEPLVAAVADGEVLAAQSLLLSPAGTIASAGSAFPRGGGLPYPFLHDFPVEDAAAVDGAPLHALSGAAVALRRSDLVALRGLDPLFRLELADADLCLRLRELRTGACVVRTDSVVERDVPPAPGRRRWLDRRLFLDRWGGRLPGDDARLWAAAGFRVVGHRPVDEGGGPRDRRLWMHEPMLARRRFDIREPEPRLRWAIKNPAPVGAAGEQWGDTHFARDLARALRRLGQAVVVDHRPASERSTGWHDDVVLVLRGRAARTPARDQVNLLWLISHPERLGGSEWWGYDRMYAASSPWARRYAAATGAPCVPLLQCTDPEVFHPDVATAGPGSPVLFVGNSRGERRPMVMWSLEAGLPLDVYGADWDGVVPARHRRATYLPHHEVGAAYRAAGVVLNDHWEDMRRTGFLSNRLFDAVAAGARVITDDVVGLDEVFGSGIQVARSPVELAALVGGDLDALFGTDQERRARAAEVHRDHSFDARARTLLDDAVEIIRRRSLGEGA